MGEFCNLDRRAERILRRLEPLVREANANGANLKLETARCLSMCGRGPNLVVYPEDASYGKLTEADVEAVMRAILLSPESEDANG
jgi:(2Fe-2S) ferredoxin